ncbi:MAG: gliding motility-associated C-terminal domain-containing protein [Crocinitomicaceae bacterium]|nr:gliding motility-associated C-terminal domain-containing protein [Crocinitomicaceae bacterium]
MNLRFFNLIVLLLSFLGGSNIFAQNYLISAGGTINTCSGNFTDAGGNGNYSDNETYVITFCSGSTDEISFDFSSFPFGLQANNDVLTIYDGPNVIINGAALWSSINGNGIQNPGVITSTTGCLTFEFVSDGVTNNIGWEATISCVSCNDGILNGNETGIDCGGPSCTPCASCFDGIQNQDETGIDCGGICAGITPPCHCGNGLLDGDETGIDCGGSCGPCVEDCNVTVSYEPTPITGGCCDYTLEMIDSYGDGWNGGQLQIIVNGSALGPFTLASGASGSQVINLCEGDVVEADYITVGSWAGEVSYSFSAPDGSVLFAGNGLNVDMNLFNGNASCSSPGVIDCNGGMFMFTAEGIGSTTITMSNDFDSGAMGTGWNSNVNADFNNPCDPSIDGGTYMWMGSSAQHPREIETVPLDLSCGGEVCFFLDFATQGNASPCEGIDLANEGVYLEYSIDGGNTWITMEYYGPEGPGNNFQNGGQNPQMTSWNQYCYTIPPGAMTPATIIHWAQTGSSGNNNDHWGLDNVTISAVENCDPYLYDWTNVSGNDNNAYQEFMVTTDTTFIVYYGNNTDACSTEVSIQIPLGPDADAGSDYTICGNGQAITIGGVPVATMDSSDFQWSTGDSGTVYYTGPNQNNGQISVSPVNDTSYYLEVTANGCTSYDTVNVFVDLPPTASNPDSLFFQCSGDVTLPDVLDVIDENDDITIPPLVSFEGEVSDGLSCPETIIRTYRVTDDCGNFVDVEQVIIVNDTTAPTIVSPPADLSVQCYDDIPASNDLQWTDNCEGTGTVAAVEVSDGLSCPETITRTWTYTDACGNSVSVSQNIIVNDTIPPTADSIADISVSGAIGLSPFDILEVTGEQDNCTVNPIVTWVSDVSDNGICPEVITRTYSVMDECGNETLVVYNIAIGDSVLPTASDPLPIAVQCSSDVPAPDPLVVTDEADNGIQPIVTWEDDTSNGQSCPELITRRYRVTDDCGNFIFVTQIIAIQDTINPVLGAVPADIVVSCPADVPLSVDVQWNDNCDGTGYVTGQDVSDGLNCPETITRVWEYIDACGNSVQDTQIIVVHDTIPPTAIAPANVVVQCIGSIPPINPQEVMGVTDNCTLNPLVSHVSDISDGLSCPETIIRTYLIQDDCGNQATVDYTITVNDTVPPTASNLPTITVPTISDIPVVDVLDVNDELDNCTINPIVTWVSDSTSGGNCQDMEILRIYSIEDDCGNSIEVSQLIIVPVLEPVIDLGADYSICIGDAATINYSNPNNAQLTWSPVLPANPFYPSSTTTYSVLAELNGCVVEDSVTIIVNEPPVFDFWGDVLEGCEIHSVNFSSDYIGQGNCLWDFGNGVTSNDCQPTTIDFPSGTFDVSLTISENGCSTSLTFEDYINVYNNPIADFTSSISEFGESNTTVQFINSSSFADSYVWDFGDNSGMVNTVSPNHDYSGVENNVLVTLWAINTEYGCVDSTYALITYHEELVYYIPNTFTPDNDEYNQTFKPVFTSGFDPYDFHMAIFNRWGELIFETYNSEFGWDGHYGNKRVQDGTYTWKIDFKESETDKRHMITGHVNLIR